MGDFFPCFFFVWKIGKFCSDPTPFNNVGLEGQIKIHCLVEISDFFFFSYETSELDNLQIVMSSMWMFLKIEVPPKSSILIGCFIIFTIRFQVSLFLETPM